MFSDSGSGSGSDLNIGSEVPITPTPAPNDVGTALLLHHNTAAAAQASLICSEGTHTSCDEKASTSKAAIAEVEANCTASQSDASGSALLGGRRYVMEEEAERRGFLVQVTISSQVRLLLTKQ